MRKFFPKKESEQKSPTDKQIEYEKPVQATCLAPVFALFLLINAILVIKLFDNHAICQEPLVWHMRGCAPEFHHGAFR